MTDILALAAQASEREIRNISDSLLRAGDHEPQPDMDSSDFARWQAQHYARARMIWAAMMMTEVLR